ncbi:MAG: hypothetical protein IPJ85_12040 [Flavobacteriales bacterium]|nr:hypothetical protein [Flavobacteriales bacterium]
MLIAPAQLHAAPASLKIAEEFNRSGSLTEYRTRIPPAFVERGFRLRKRSKGNGTHDSHYIFGTSAIPQAAGSGYYQSHDIVMQSVSYSPVEGLSIGGGVQLASLISSIIAGKREPLAYARIQASGPVADGAAHLGGFCIAGKTSVSPPQRDGQSWPVFLGLGAAQATFGRDPAHITISIGGTMDDQGLRDGLLIGIAGLWRVSDPVAVITENWQLPIGKEPYRVYSLGARYTYRALAFDAAFALNKDLLEFSPVGAPILGISVGF